VPAVIARVTKGWVFLQVADSVAALEEPIVGTKIQVSLAADAGYKRQLAVTLSSLAAASEPDQCAVTVLHQQIPAPDRDRITKSVASRLELTWVSVDRDALSGLHYPPWLTSATLVRLILPRLLPGVDRTIYLDSDIVVLRPLTELWEQDLGDALVGAVRDASMPWAAGPIGTHWRDLGLPPETPYFNAGVLLVPLATWRSQDLTSAALELLRHKRLQYADQDALNGVIAGRWLELPRRWNLQTFDWDGQGFAWATARAEVESALADPAIIHYTSPGRPWWSGSPHPKADLWFEYLDQTPWSGWRPAAKRTRWREAAFRAKRAGRILLNGA
jgi:lipopolysaccharide biosynthesis glycosyltransferase